MTGVVNYEQGSGRGRLVQYEHSLAMAAHHPIFGVGPGNWAVDYPNHAARNDPSMSDSEGGMTFNPWPSSDWVAFVAERGLAATVLLALALIGVVVGVLRRSRSLESGGFAAALQAERGTLLAVAAA